SAADAAHAASRALRLDPGFVHRTNPGWQKTHLTEVIRKFGAGGQHSLLLPDSPTDRLLIHLHAERWFDLLGL
ncbi:MAG: hypothetical protein ACXVBW_10005, partial [Bdellovibrionota bacterium]